MCRLHQQDQNFLRSGEAKEPAEPSSEGAEGSGHWLFGPLERGSHRVTRLSSQPALREAPAATSSPNCPERAWLVAKVKLRLREERALWRCTQLTRSPNLLVIGVPEPPQLVTADDFKVGKCCSCSEPNRPNHLQTPPQMVWAQGSHLRNDHP